MRGFLRRWPVLAWMSLGSALLILALGWLITLPVFEGGPAQSRVGEGELIPLLPGTVAKGRVMADRKGLSRIRVRVATYLRRNVCEVDAVLFEKGRILAEARLNTSWFPDLGWVEIPFYPLGSSLDKGEYEVRFRSPDSGPENAVALSGRTGESLIMLQPVYLEESLPAWSWLAQRRPRHLLPFIGLTGFLALGGLIIGVGAYLRKRAGDTD